VPRRPVEVADGVGPEGRKYALAQTVGGKLGMVPQLRCSRVCRGDDLDLEAVEQCAGTELRVGHARCDLVIDGVGCLGARD
jgi:hypothetical protein